MTNMCPVCGYTGLHGPAYHGPKGDCPSHEICPSCGYQYGFTDDAKHISHTEWRTKWINNGMKWRGGGRQPPADWNPVEQLKNIGVTIDT